MSSKSATPEQVKKKVQDAYLEAVQNRNMFSSPASPRITDMLREVKLYGRDAGMDFVETHLSTIIQDAVAKAECKKPSFTFPAYSCGRSAVAGMATKLGELTALKVEANASTVTLTWVDTVPQMV